MAGPYYFVNLSKGFIIEVTRKRLIEKNWIFWWFQRNTIAPMV